MQNLMQTYQEVRVRANGVCEGEGCTEEHLKPAKSYKGKVVLLINHKRAKIVNDPDLMLALCLKCSGRLDYVKHGRKMKPRKKVMKGTNQISLMELLK